jgi:hypothetical protein
MLAGWMEGAPGGGGLRIYLYFYASNVGDAIHGLELLRACGSWSYTVRRSGRQAGVCRPHKI